VSRIEGKIGGDNDKPVDASEILQALQHAEGDPRRRQRAVSCYLSASEGWEKALDLLGGAFAAADDEGAGGKSE
jgi:hypothetical protein